MTNSVKTNDFNEILTGRRSIRKYDTSVKISKRRNDKKFLQKQHLHHLL